MGTQVLYLHGPSGLPGRVSGNYSLELAKLRAEGSKRKDKTPEIEKKVKMLDKLIRKPPMKKVVYMILAYH